MNENATVVDLTEAQANRLQGMVAAQAQAVAALAQTQVVNQFMGYLCEEYGIAADAQVGIRDGQLLVFDASSTGETGEDGQLEHR